MRLGEYHREFVETNPKQTARAYVSLPKRAQAQSLTLEPPLSMEALGEWLQNKSSKLLENLRQRVRHIETSLLQIP